LFKTHKGDKQLHFVIYEMENKIKLSMPSRKQKVNISQELLDELTRAQVSYRLN
jgi:DNA polymerase-3 subunit alpha